MCSKYVVVCQAGSAVRLRKCQGFCSYTDIHTYIHVSGVFQVTVVLTNIPSACLRMQQKLIQDDGNGEEQDRKTFPTSKTMLTSKYFFILLL